MQNALSIATMGLLSGNPLTIAVNGYTFSIVIEPVTQRGGGISINTPYQEKKKPKLKITVTCIKDGEELKKSIYTKKINIQVKDLKIDIIENKI